MARTSGVRRALILHAIFLAPVLAAGLTACGRNRPATAAAVSAGPAEAAPAPRLALAPCRVPGLDEEVRCGTYEVFENRSARQGRRIGLRVAVLPAASPTPATDPLFYLAGGPGQSAVAAAGMVARTFAEARRERDIVLLDQRGTGGSHPLNCTLYGGAEDPQSYLGDMLPVAALRACLAAFDADPALYTTPVAADDLDEVRAALGYERINLYGISYGSRLALVYMRQHPGRVRSALLHGVVPTNMKIPFFYARDSQRALDLLFEECAADEACGKAYPDLREKFAAVQARLAAAPASVEIQDPAMGDRPVRFLLSLDNFNEGVRWRLYDEGSNRVPAYIQQAYDGDFTLVAREIWRLRRMASQGNLLSAGVFMTVTCSEDAPFIDMEEARLAAAESFLGTYRVEQQVKSCQAWPRGELPPGYAEDVRSDVPVLLLSGFRDPVTPPSWGEQVARHLSNSRHLVLREGFHGEPDPCVAGIMNELFVRGAVQGLDLSCLENVKKAPFVLPAGQSPR
ncbi:MAG TPA: alpha/beta hydrolase [Thermoanaerobaculia bacterium]